MRRYDDCFFGVALRIGTEGASLRSLTPSLLSTGCGDGPLAHSKLMTLSPLVLTVVTSNGKEVVCTDDASVREIYEPTTPVTAYTDRTCLVTVQESSSRNRRGPSGDARLWNCFCGHPVKSNKACNLAIVDDLLVRKSAMLFPADPCTIVCSERAVSEAQQEDVRALWMEGLLCARCLRCASMCLRGAQKSGSFGRISLNVVRKSRGQIQAFRVLRILQMPDFLLLVRIEPPALLLSSFCVVQYHDMLIGHGQHTGAILGLSRSDYATSTAIEDGVKPSCIPCLYATGCCDKKMVIAGKIECSLCISWGRTDHQSCMMQHRKWLPKSATACGSLPPASLPAPP
ncbi:hypothetical protein KC363_g115 [Hortaea werneckii]|nr:hypothetical protein KC363_g115 [Hortaea werneckii]